MKISEEDLLILAETYHIQSYDKTSSLFRFCRELIKLAQEVEPLKFEYCEKCGCWMASSLVGQYIVCRFNLNCFLNGISLFEGSDCESSAIERCQQDYAKRMKSGLKYGGGE